MTFRKGKEIEIIASRFHVGLFFGHAIALWFNWRRKRYGHAAVHAAFLAYDGWAAFTHQTDASDDYESFEDARWRELTKNESYNDR